MHRKRKAIYTPLIPAKESGRHLFWTNFNIHKIETKHVAIKNAKGLSGDFRMNEYGSIVKDWHGYKGDKRKIFKNCVDPQQGEYILNCAKNIIHKRNLEQQELFSQ